MTIAEITGRYGSRVSARGIRPPLPASSYRKDGHTPPWASQNVKGQTWESCFLAAVALTVGAVWLSHSQG